MRLAMPAPDPIAANNAAPGRWLAIVGIGEDGVEGLTPTARRLVEGAEFVFGGARHLRLAAPLIRGAVRSWPSPFNSAVEEVLSHRGRQVCVLASGDPFHYGVGPLLSGAVAADEIVAVPVPSAFSLAAARLGWALPETILLSLHGRSPDLIRPHLHPGARIIALTTGGDAPADIANLIADAGFGRSRLTVLEALGGRHEQVRSANADRFDIDGIDPLNTVAVEVVAGPGATIVPFTPGLPDALFEHDGQITKRDVRAVTLSSLAPRRGELLWDIGAGAGSVAIEWLLANRSLRAVAVEADPARAARIARNAAALGVPGLVIVEGPAPGALAGLAEPDAVFVGCGAADAAILDTAIAALRSGGRLVVNAVTLESEAALLARHATLGGDLLRIAVARAEPLGGVTGWRPAMAITQWVWIKP
jgi:precorrin-6Y C5,15-methyltransferase (decarboxylating)